MTGTCRHDGSGVIRLWDGRDHCAECVEAACPGLVEFARARGALVDAIPYDRAGGLAVWARFAGLFFGVLALTGAGFFAGMDLASASLLVGCMAGVGAVSILGSLPFVFKARSVLPTVRVSGGTVEVFRPSHAEGRRPVATFPLAEARWHLGRIRDDASCAVRNGPIVPDRPAVILRAPIRWKGIGRPSNATATGSTPEMIRIWRAFLRLAGVPEGR